MWFGTRLNASKFCQTSISNWISNNITWTELHLQLVQPSWWICSKTISANKILVRLPVPPWSQHRDIEPLHRCTWGCCVKFHGYVGMLLSLASLGVQGLSVVNALPLSVLGKMWCHICGGEVIPGLGKVYYLPPCSSASVQQRWSSLMISTSTKTSELRSYHITQTSTRRDILGHKVNHCITINCNLITWTRLFIMSYPWRTPHTFKESLTCNSH